MEFSSEVISSWIFLVGTFWIIDPISLPVKIGLLRFSISSWVSLGNFCVSRILFISSRWSNCLPLFLTTFSFLVDSNVLTLTSDFCHLWLCLVSWQPSRKGSGGWMLRSCSAVSLFVTICNPQSCPKPPPYFPSLSGQGWINEWGLNLVTSYSPFLSLEMFVTFSKAQPCV